MTWTPEQIRALRHRLRYNQYAFAAALGYSRNQSVSDLERGRMEPTPTICRLLEHLDAHGDLPSEAARRCAEG